MAGNRVVGYITETDIPKVAKEHREALTNLSSLKRQVTELYQAGKFREAIPIARESLELSEKALGPDHPATAEALSNLARLYYSKGDYARAGWLLQHALKIKEKVLGPNHPDTATALNNLARLYSSTGHYAKAEPLLERLLKLREKALGPDHPDTLEGISGPLGHLRGGRISGPALWDVASIADSLESESGAKKAKHRIMKDNFPAIAFRCS